ncbi:mRNA-degrading endonuclease RelE, toxin component of the RelBE toxin-antitoxin system [Verrucomicrobium sp. GAS474]|uniref:type II toxin-antitoxin system RelE family toxin n=1 Tax=Verrucomicrobium sp. GAS474 TaxID=1882831 RepID=UPI00087BEB16|nr:hypothetical protein [Verrucomicrobium sp. GAS474]SDT86570.1 mRNA-degrading endonuclease RelE, toxin component of the RelBE toxin-antitoxin system [Verrucomicrobium sp. GAS474]
MSSIEVRLREQVVDFLRRLPPDPRHRMREAIRNLREEKGETKALQGELEGYHRLRVGSYRVIYQYEVENGRRIIGCVFAERRSTIYDLFIDMVSDRLREKRMGEPEVVDKAAPAKGKPYRIPRAPKEATPPKKRSGSKADKASPPRPARTKTAPRSPGK